MLATLQAKDEELVAKLLRFNAVGAATVGLTRGGHAGWDWAGRIGGSKWLGRWLESRGRVAGSSRWLADCGCHCSFDGGANAPQKLTRIVGLLLVLCGKPMKLLTHHQHKSCYSNIALHGTATYKQRCKCIHTHHMTLFVCPSCHVH